MERKTGAGLYSTGRSARPLFGRCGPQFDEFLTTPSRSIITEIARKDRVMLAFEIIGGIFALLFLAAAMTGIEGAGGR